MNINELTPEPEALAELGRRLARTRKQRGYTQAELAHTSGIGIATLKRIESGQDAQLGTWLKLLGALSLSHSIDSLLPENFKSPMAQARASAKRRRKQPSRNAENLWGDEQT